MPVAQLLYGSVDKYQPVISSDFQSVEVDSGTTTTFANAARQFLIVNALVDVYVSFTNDGSTPDTTKQPRVKVLAGTNMAFGIRSGVKVKVTTV